MKFPHPTHQEAAARLFSAAQEEVLRLYGATDRPASILIRTSAGRRILLDVPVFYVPPTLADTRPVKKKRGPRRHGPEFRSVFWYGRRYSFTPQQAKAVSVLWKAMKQGTPDVPDANLIRACAATSSRLADVFRDSAAWGTMIVEGETRGTHRLAVPN